MPPKRKAEDTEKATQRRSARLSGNPPDGTKSHNTRSAKVKSNHTDPQPSKATRKSKTKEGKADAQAEDVAPPQKKPKKATKSEGDSHTVKSTQKGKSIHPSFTQARTVELFDTYRDKEVTDEEVIGSEGLERFCHDTQLDMEGPKPLLLAWILGAKRFGRFLKEEWVNGSSTWQLDTTDKFATAVNDVHQVLFGDASAPHTKERDAYKKDLLHQYENDPPAAFRQFYVYIFELTKEQARNVDMETATALWSVILGPRYPLSRELIEFINDKKTYRGVNKDLWSMTLEFCQEFSGGTLDSYEADGAWPTLLDDFVASRKSDEKEL